METIKNTISGNSADKKTSNPSATKSESSGGWGDKFNSALGGGKKSEANEDYLDKGVDLVQEHVLGQGPQNNESAIEQAKDEQISDFVRGRYKTAAGKDFPVQDK